MAKMTADAVVRKLVIRTEREREAHARIVKELLAHNARLTALDKARGKPA